ncbi:Glutamyl-tRNA synthetase [hydrothermal vent metagenome]|uniref:glutamate--tRNA ligase n=1 Tax=hydrothermal vent metagenome TaxID=652676 RepID=A0A1W1CBP6_9ZZZZ
MKTRFAPSPTGDLHIGGARTALFSWLWAKKNKGEFLLRIEDTDLERSTQQSINVILEAMKWLGLDYDGQEIYQTKRFERYKEIIAQLLKEDKAYYCTCSKERLNDLREGLKAKGEKAKYDGLCRNAKHKSGVIRFKNPIDGVVSFNDEVKGIITIANNELDDLIIERSDGSPTYNLSVVVDDHDMDIETIIRGDDHINNTPRQINLYQALGWEVPKFAHLPMILGSDGSRLSKRHGSVNVMQYRNDGFLPEAILNYLVRLGWSYGDKEEFSINEMIELFELKNINKAAASFNAEKLLWLNQQYIKKTDNDELIKHLDWHFKEQNITPNKQLDAVITILKERSKTLKELAEQSAMFFQDIIIDDSLAKKHITEKSKQILNALLQKLKTIDKWNAENIKTCITEVCAEFEIGFGKVGQPFRLALSGNGISPSIDITAELVGQKITLNRLEKIIKLY